MQLRYLENLQNPQDGMQKVTAIAWSPNSQRLAVVGVDKIVQLFDENGERRDRFSTKPADKSQKTYVVKGISFSPDSTKLAIAQSDSIVLRWLCKRFRSVLLLTRLHFLKYRLQALLGHVSRVLRSY